MKKILIATLLLSGCTSLEKQQSNERAQVEIVKVQREAMAREESDRTKAQIALYESLAKIAESSPESADAAVLAMAMVGQGASEKSADGPVVQLREQRNEAIELTKALAPTVGNVVSAVGMAAVNASVQKRQIAATAAVQIQDSNNDAAIVQSVASLGTAAVGAVGDNITVTDDAWVNMGSYQDNDTTNTTTNNTTNNTTSTATNNTTNTATSIADYYNSADDNSTTTNNTTNTETNTSDSNNTTDNSTTTTTTTTTDNSVVTYAGQEMTLDSLLAYLQGTGLAYSLTIGDTTYTIDGDGDPVEVDCVEEGEVGFGPSVVCQS